MVDPINLAGYASVLNGLEGLKDQFDGNVTYVVGTNTAYGVHLEFGTRKMQQYPWLRPAVREFKKNPERFISKHTTKSIDRIGSGEEMVKTVALALETRMKENLSAGERSDRSPGTHPQHPQAPTGNLRGSVEAERLR